MMAVLTGRTQKIMLQATALEIIVEFPLHTAVTIFWQES